MKLYGSVMSAEVLDKETSTSRIQKTAKEEIQANTMNNRYLLKLEWKKWRIGIILFLSEGKRNA